jgi:tetratricopeptide (TPR) repeat protein
VRQITSVAVVPFRDLDGTPEGHVFADGISEMVATRLAQARELRVATPFNGAPIREGDDVRAIARRTGAGAVVRGTVQRVGGDVRVTASLIDARSGSTLEATTLTRPANDLFALQDAVADELLSVLGRPLDGTPPATAAAVLGAEDQRRFTEAVGLLQRVRDEQSVDRAIASLEAILRNSRQSGPVNALLARALLYKSSLARRPALIEQATVYATRGVALSGSDPESHITLGQLQNASGRHEEAVKSFERALTLRPQSPGAFLGLADAYNGQGRGAEAEKMYQKVLTMRPDETGAMSRYGSFCYRQGRYEDAARYFRKAAELQPELPQAHANLGAALQALGRYDEALLSYQRSLAVEPTAAGYSNLGTLQFSLGRYDAARESYERAARLAPSDPVIWANLGDACRWSPSGKSRANEAYARAIAAGRDALESNPRDAYTRSVVALSLAKSGKADYAHDEIRRALELDPTNTSVLYKAAVIALIRGNSDSAVSWIERAVANGYPAAELDRDPELASIRHLPPLRKALESRIK